MTTQKLNIDQIFQSIHRNRDKTCEGFIYTGSGFKTVPITPQQYNLIAERLSPYVTSSGQTNIIFDVGEQLKQRSNL